MDHLLAAQHCAGRTEAAGSHNPPLPPISGEGGALVLAVRYVNVAKHSQEEEEEEEKDYNSDADITTTKGNKM